MPDAATSNLRRIRLVLWVLVAVVAVGATALFLFRPPASPVGVTGQPFTLTATTGETFTQNDLRGKPSLVFFGYTFCPDVCPTTLGETLAWREATGASYDELRTIFVTVDPERDTPEMLREYLGGFDPNVIGLVGTPEQTEQAKAAFGVRSERAEGGDAEFYLVNHTASVFLIGADGGFRGTIAYEEGIDSAVAKIRRLIGT